MIDASMIPREARLAATKAHLRDKAIDEIIAAALAAWPGVHIGAPWVIGVPNAPSLILPLTKESSDED
jgi:hypothetical protein